MRLTEKIIAALQNTFDTLIFFATMAAKEDFRNHVVRAGAQDMNPSRRLAILGNGPSLAEQLLKLIEQREWEKADMLAVNFFALSEEFLITKRTRYMQKHTNTSNRSSTRRLTNVTTMPNSAIRQERTVAVSSS